MIPAETDKQKQERFEIVEERDRSRCSTQTANGRDKRELLAAEIKHQIAADECPLAQTERLAAESATERDIRL